MTVSFVKPLVIILSERQQGKCIWCGFPMGRTTDHCFEIAEAEFPGVPYYRQRFAAKCIRETFEHMVPRVAGGPVSLENGACSCWWCNMWRIHDEPLIYAARVQALVAARRHPRQVYRQTGLWPRGFPRKVPDAP